MKKKIFVLAIVLCLYLGVKIIMDKQHSGEISNETASDAYVFPITEDSPEWRNYDTLDKKLEVMQVPGDILVTMSTNGLIQTVLQHPLLPNVYATSSDDVAFLQVYKQLNVIDELCARDDAGTLLLNYYANVDDIIQWKALDLILSSSYIQEKLTNDEKKVFEQLREHYNLQKLDLLNKN